MDKLFCFILISWLSLSLAAPSGGENMEGIMDLEFLTANCHQCGMTLFGSVMTKGASGYDLFF